MPFGKFKGVPVSELPADYLGWLLSLGDLLREPLRSAVEGERERRTSQKPEPEGISELFEQEVRSMKQGIIDAGFRALAKRFHPDTGGGHHHGGHSEIRCRPAGCGRS